MARKQVTLSRKMLFVWFLLAGFIILFCPEKLTDQFQMAFAQIFHWPLNVSRNFMLSARTEQSLKPSNSRSETELRNYIANLEARLDEEIRKNQQLADFRKIDQNQQAKLIFANITKALPGELIINSGKNDGIYKGLFVLGDNTIIGTIDQVWTHTSKVKLITHPSSKMAVKIADKDAVIEGAKDNQVKVSLFPTTSNVTVGDAVYCQPKPGFLNTPVIIGKVADCKKGPNPFLWDISVEPACNIASLSRVCIIILNTQPPVKEKQ